MEEKLKGAFAKENTGMEGDHKRILEKIEKWRSSMELTFSKTEYR